MIATLRQRNFLLLWFAGLISFSGDWFLAVALPVAIYQLTQSPLEVSLMLAASTIPRIVLGSVAGVFVDRWERKRTMVIANLLLALVLLPLLLDLRAERLWLVYAAVFTKGIIGQFLYPAEDAMLPQLVGKKHLVSANALNSLNNNLARLIGPALGGLVFGLAGLGVVVLVDILSFVAAAGLIAMINVKSQPVRAAAQTATSAWAKVLHEWRDGLAFIRGDRVLRTIFVCVAIMSVGEGVMSTLFAPFVTNVLGGSALEYGWLMSAQAVGGLVGGVAIARVGKNAKPGALLAFGAFFVGAIDLLIFNYSAFVPGVLPGVLLFILVGVPAVSAMTGYATMVQTQTADEYRGRVFGALGTFWALFMLCGMGFAGLMGERLGIVAVLNIQGYGYMLTGIIAFLMLRGTAMTPQPEIQQEAA
jgi:predicted MFS family arabinose efflux permease